MIAAYIMIIQESFVYQYGLPKAGGVAHVPPGWDHWNALVSVGT